MFLFKENSSHHSLIIGASGKGKSFLTEAYAKENNITYEEAEKRLSPSEEQLKARKEALEEEKRLNNLRMKKVKEVYWENYSDSEYEFGNFHDALVSNLGINNPSQEQIKEFFLMIPDEIFGSGIAHGFSDSVVRDDIHEFARDNVHEIFKVFMDKDLKESEE